MSNDMAYLTAAEFVQRTLIDSALPRTDDGDSIWHPQLELGDDVRGGCGVSFNVAGGKLIVLVEGYWRYPGEVCYFVNWTHASNGNFRCGAGVNNVWAALLDVGCAIEFARNAGDKQEAPQQTPV